MLSSVFSCKNIAFFKMFLVLEKRFINNKSRGVSEMYEFLKFSHDLTLATLLKVHVALRIKRSCDYMVDNPSL